MKHFLYIYLQLFSNSSLVNSTIYANHFAYVFVFFSNDQYRGEIPQKAESFANE